VQLLAMYRRELVQPLPAPEARVPIEISPVGSDELAEVADIDGRGEELEALFRWRVANGHHPLQVRVDGEAVAYNWFALGDTRDGDELLRMADDEAFLYDGYTAVAWRGLGIHPALHCWQMQYAYDMGIRTAYSSVLVTTRRSAQLMKQMDWSLTGWVVHLKGRGGRGGRLLRLWGSAHPYAGIAPRE
jgi:hypothetical protein